MCVKIISTEKEQEFNPSEPLEHQIVDAEKILVNYDPLDPRINSFVGEIERLCNSGISCNFDIKFNANNFLNGFKVGKHLENLKRKLYINELIIGLSKLHSETDRKLSELSSMCLGENDEQ